MTVKFLWAIVCPAVACLSPDLVMAAAPPSAPGVSFTQILPDQTIFNWKKTACSTDHFIPDGPARAWKRADGKFTLIAAEADNWQLVGNNLFDLQASCRPTLSDGVATSGYAYGPTTALPVSSQYTLSSLGYVGIEATYTMDGQTIYGFAGEDLSLLAYAEGCIDKGTGNCWLNGIRAVTSSDMGDDFSFVSPGIEDVAALTRTISTNRKGLDGYMTTSNIIRKTDGYYYMISDVNDTEDGKEVDCLLRTNNLADPTSWRGWDGRGFNASLQPKSNGSLLPPCVQVGYGQLRQSVYSLQYISSKNLYVAVMQTRIQMPGDARAVPGAYYTTSSDLINWSPVARLAVTPLTPGYDSTTEVDFYPVLIDPFSKSRNFETIDSNTPVLVYTRGNLANGGSLTLNRDLVAVPLLMK